MFRAIRAEKSVGRAQSGSHGLYTGAPHVVERVLLSERPAGSLRVGTQHQRLGVLGIKLLDDLGPQHTGGAHLGNLHEMVHGDTPEERQARSESVDVDTGVYSGANIFKTVGNGISQLDVCSGAGFLHVVAGNGDGVELRHQLRRVSEDVADDTHRECRRIYIGIAHHELLEDVVLDSARHLLELGALFQSCHDIERHDGKHGSVHCHGHRHLVERYAVEKDFHVLHRADRHTGFTHIAHNTCVVGVVTAVRGEVERHRQPLLSAGKVSAVERVTLLCRREAGVLTDSPRAERVHHAVRTAQERRQTSRVVEVFHSLKVFLRVNRLHLNVLRGFPVCLDAVVLLPSRTIDILYP